MIRKIIEILCISLSCVACGDMLELDPENSLTFENGLDSELALESTLNSVQYKIRQSLGCGQWGMIVRGIMCDTTEASVARNFEYTTAPKNSWDDHYEVIAGANVVLHYADQISMQQERRDYYRGAAYFYKAFAYLELIQYWGDCVLVEEDVPMESLAKSYWTQVADHAIELAEKAVALLPDFDKVTASNGDAVKYKSAPCKGAANTVLAQLAAWKAGCKWFAQSSERNYDENELWEKAEAACTAIIGSESGPATGIYQLVSSPEEVCGSVLLGGSKESLYESQYIGFWEEFDLYGWHPLQDQALLFQTWPMMDWGEEEVKDVNVRIYANTVKKMYAESDLRREAYFYKLDSMSHDTLLGITGGFAYPYKYRKVAVMTSGSQIGEFWHIDQNRVWWRLADIYLLRAECRARLNKTELAIADVNEIRKRANAPLYEASENGGDLRMTVFKEREKELIFEGYRYLDIVRNNYVRGMMGRGYRAASDQDYIDGCLFWAINTFAFHSNPRMRQNTYWQKYAN